MDRYRRRAVDDEWDMGGLGVATREAERNEFRPSLGQMYVPLRFTPVPSGGGVKADEGAGAIEAAPLEPAVIVDAGRPMILRGAAGRGKSTWMRWTFSQLLARADVVPLFVELRSLAQVWAELLTAERTIERYLAITIARDLSEDAGRVHEYVKVLLARAHGPRPILLIDGWDELGDQGDDLRKRLVTLLRVHPRVGAVVTSRPYAGSKPSHSEGFVGWELELLDDAGVDTLIRHYFDAAYPHDTKRAAKERAEFRDALENADRVRDLARTPLLLTMMLIISRSRALPDQRHELYKACIDTLLVDRPAVRARQGARTDHKYWAPKTVQERWHAVTALARWMHEDSERHLVGITTSVERAEVIDQLCGFAGERERSKQFVDWLVDIAGLLIESNSGALLSFVHLSFQEYLCALHLHRDEAYEGEEQRIALCRERMGRLGWWEPLRLWAAILHGDNPDKLSPVLNALIDGRVVAHQEDPFQHNSKKATAFALAGAILADGHGNAKDCQHWSGGLAMAFTGHGHSPMEECARAWRGSRQHKRRRAIETALLEQSPAWSWLEWRLAVEWATSANLPTERMVPGGLAVPVVGLLQRDGRVVADASERAAREIALSRVLSGATPWWPCEPMLLSLLRLWPAHRSVVGIRLQTLLSLSSSGGLMISDPGLPTPVGYQHIIVRDLNEYQLRLFAQHQPRYLPRDLISRLSLRLGKTILVDAETGLDLSEDPDFAQDYVLYFARDFPLRLARDLDSDLGRRLGLSPVPDSARDFALDLARIFAREPSDPRFQMFAACELRSVFGRAGVRVAVADSHEQGDPLLDLLRAACRISLTGTPDPTALAEPLAALPSDTHPLWPALARWLSRCAEPNDQSILEHHAAHPEDCDTPLSWGLKYIVRGDLIRPDGSEVTLDELCDEAGAARLPLLEPMPPEFDLGELTEPPAG